ncbi:MAG: HlyC/CorC family transporter [Clostridiales bacterium]|nr:HlyC/CorC family transporter [Clostridiales bacterium]
MDDDGPTASIIFFVVLLLIDVFFYGFGSAIHCLNIKDVEKRAKDGKDKKSERLRSIIANPAKYVNTVQVASILIHILMGGIYLRIWLQGIRRFMDSFLGNESSKFHMFGAEVAGAVSLILTAAALIYILLTFGVLLPKKLAARYPEKWAYFFINPVYYVTGALSPFTGLATLTAGGILRLFGLKEDKDATDVTEEEIISMVNEGHEQGVLQETEAEMITNIFEFGDTEAQEIMTHRKNIVAVEGTMSLKEAISFMMNANNSRFPVYEENIDHIIGIVHMRDAMRLHNADAQANLPIKEIEGLLRTPVFIPTTKNIDDLFRMMQSTKTQMVIVVDEYGQTSGLLAMEDILEEIVGNILDEYDEDEEYIEETGNADEYIIDGHTPLEELEERFGISFEEEDFETLNGFLISRLDKIPEEDEEFDIDVDGYNFKILSVESKMISSVLVTKIKEPKQEDFSDDEKDKKEKK